MSDFNILDFDFHETELQFLGANEKAVEEATNILNESALWNYLNKGMKPYWAADRHEDKLNFGVPDVSYTIQNRQEADARHGWVELKAVSHWPKRGGPFVIKHFTPEQREWLERRFPGTYLLIGICGIGLSRQEREFVLLDGISGARLIGKVGREALLKAAVGYWTGKIDFDELRGLL